MSASGETTEKEKETTEKEKDTAKSAASDKNVSGDTPDESGEMTESKTEAHSYNHYDVAPTEDSTFRMDTDITVDPAIIEHLSKGFLQRFLPALEKSKSAVTEILTNQNVLIDTLEQENSKFTDCTAHAELTNMMLKAKNYHNKLLTIKRDMGNLHDKAGRLKKRALKLQQQKQREELQRAHQEERQMEKEHMLTARVAQPDKT